MTIITTYTTLVQGIKDILEDDGTEFSDFIPTAIDLAEERLFKDLDAQDLRVSTTGTTTNTINTLDKPTGYRFPHNLTLTISNSKVFLEKKMEDFLIDYWPNSTLTGVPKYYSDAYSQTQFLLAPTPDSAYTYTLKYTKQPTKLSVSNDSNYYTTDCKDVLFSACLVEMAKFMKAWQQLQVWEAEYTTLRDAWNLQEMRKRRDDLAVPNAPDAGSNTLKHTLNSGA